MWERFQLQEILFLWTVQQFLKYHYQKAFTWFCWHICGLYPTPEGALKWPFSWHKTTEIFRTSKTSNNKLLIIASAVHIWCDVRPPNKTPVPFNSQDLNSQYITKNCQFAKKEGELVFLLIFWQSVLLHHIFICSVEKWAGCANCFQCPVLFQAAVIFGSIWQFSGTLSRTTNSMPSFS